jgi:hypothetical protein
VRNCGAYATLSRTDFDDVLRFVEDGGYALRAYDRFRKLFLATFGFHTEPFSPLDFLTDVPDTSHALEAAGISDYRPDAVADEGEGA